MSMANIVLKNRYIDIILDNIFIKKTELPNTSHSIIDDAALFASCHSMLRLRMRRDDIATLRCY